MLPGGGEGADGGRAAVSAGAAASGGAGASAGAPASADTAGEEDPAPSRRVRARSWDPPAGAPIRLILVRHGETEMTAQRRYSGRGDVALSSKGKAQAEAMGARLAGMEGSITAVISSPLARCTETAAAISEALDGLPVQTDSDLIECDFGDWEGRTFADVRDQWPAEMERWLESTAVAPPGGESMRAVAVRTRRALERIRETRAGQWVVVVSHVSPVKLVLRDALAASDDMLYRLYLDPAGMSIVDYWADGGVAVRTVNDTAHLIDIDVAPRVRGRH